jgi:hypothetical protein
MSNAQLFVYYCGEYKMTSSLGGNFFSSLRPLRHAAVAPVESLRAFRIAPPFVPIDAFDVCEEADCAMVFAAGGVTEIVADLHVPEGGVLAVIRICLNRRTGQSRFFTSVPIQMRESLQGVECARVAQPIVSAVIGSSSLKPFN